MNTVLVRSLTKTRPAKYVWLVVMVCFTQADTNLEQKLFDRDRALLVSRVAGVHGLECTHESTLSTRIHVCHPGRRSERRGRVKVERGMGAESYR